MDKRGRQPVSLSFKGFCEGHAKHWTPEDSDKRIMGLYQTRRYGWALTQLLKIQRNRPQLS